MGPPACRRRRRERLRLCSTCVVSVSIDVYRQERMPNLVVAIRNALVTVREHELGTVTQRGRIQHFDRASRGERLQRSGRGRPAPRRIRRSRPPVTRLLCIACGEASPACSANCQHDRVSTSDNNPSRNERACRRGSTRPNRPAIAANPVSKSARTAFRGRSRHPDCLRVICWHQLWSVCRSFRRFSGRATVVPGVLRLALAGLWRRVVCRPPARGSVPGCGTRCRRRSREAATVALFQAARPLQPCRCR